MLQDDRGDMDQEMQVHQALLRQAEAAAHMQNLMQSQLGLGGFANFPNLPMGLGLHSQIQAQLQAQIQALSGGGSRESNGGSGNGDSQSPPGMGPPKTSSPISYHNNNASQNR